MKETLEELVIGDKVITQFGSDICVCTVIGKSEKTLFLQMDKMKKLIFDFYAYPRAWTHYIPKKPWYKRLFKNF